MALTKPSQLVFATMVNGTYTGYIEVAAPSLVSFSAWGTAGSFSSAVITLFLSHDSGTTYHAFTPAPDPAAPLTGVAFSLTAALDTNFRITPCLIKWVIASGSGESINIAWGGRHIRFRNDGTTS